MRTALAHKRHIIRRLISHRAGVWSDWNTNQPISVNSSEGRTARLTVVLA